jgi:hypothetical protein
MSKKIGRPPTPKGEAKTEFRGAFFAPDEAKTVDQAIAESGQDKSKWIRSTLLDGAKLKRPPLNTLSWWGEIPFPPAELHGKKVAFKLWVSWEENKPPLLTTGTGVFFIRKGPMGFHVRIHVRYCREREKIIDLTAEMAKYITRQPDGSKCGFSLVLPQF